jgi:hypothetical protein
MPPERTVTVDLGGAMDFEPELVIRVKGAPCRIERAQRELFAALIDLKRSIETQVQAAEPKPCGGCPGEH